MRIKNLTDLLHGVTITSREPPAPEMVVLVQGTYQITAGGSLDEVEGIAPQLAQGPLNADRYAEDDVEMSGALLAASDFADFKPHAEVIVYGQCHPPQPTARSEVRVALGDWSKTLRVWGDRHFRDDGSISQPQLFERMPLDFHRAFGGPGDEVNPCGKGLPDPAGGQEQRIELPNVELPDEPVVDRSSRPEPGSLCPINPNWPARAKKRGEQYGDDYQKTRAPFYAADFDWTYFQATSPDQWLASYPRGDETLELTHLIAASPNLQVPLPAIRVRVFALDDQPRFREIPMVIDTITVHGDDARLAVSWRGLDTVRERDLFDVGFVLIASEPLASEPLPLSHYRALMAKFEDDPAGIKEAQENILKQAGEAAGGIEPIDDPDPLTKAMLDRGAPIPTSIQQQIKDGQQLMQQAPDRTGIDKIDLAAVVVAHDKPPPEVPDEPPPALLIYPGSQPRLFLRPQIMQMREQLAAAKARSGGQGQESFEEAEKKLYDPRLPELDPTLRESSEEAPAPGADLSGQDLSGRDFRDADLRGARFDGCVLIGTQFGGANLEGASFAGAMLFKADLTDAKLKGANLSRVNAAYAKLDGADVSNANIDAAYFANADLSRACFEGAAGSFVSLVEARLVTTRAAGMKLTKSSFESAELTDVDLRGASLVGCHLHKSRGRGVLLQQADLTEAVFMEADMTGVNLAGVTLDRSIWTRALLEGAELSGCHAHNAHFTESKLSGASFVRADLRGARFYRCDLRRVDFSHSNLYEADLSRATLDKTKFVEANLFEAKLLEATGPGCDFSGANLERAVIEAS